jgi:hypothetical protein
MLGGDDGCTLYIAANQWTGARASDGMVLLHQVCVPRYGRP